ncbi:hypothetical protein DPMN_152642 [Dreissena polymorpha]|uniref:Peptidase M28 domain-containing protein n=1 Tax=Dreissena polymorpha TaxID=45954 RepID=A0A9D4J845_DREPO|nr:hypothetical protein DPMN_152642 [Dreissena polymorpha]
MRHVFQPMSDSANASNASNVIGVLNGSNIGTADDKPVGVSAHYDTYDISPGVNDNGSGMAALLEVARLLTDQHKKGFRRNNTIIFVAFDLEESSYAGSKQFKEGWLNPWTNRSYGKAASSITLQGIIVMDTVMAYNESNDTQRLPPGISVLFPTVKRSIESNGKRGDFIVNIYRKDKDSLLGKNFTSAWKKLSKLRIEELPLPFSNVTEMENKSLHNLLRSDHRSLWADDIPAIFLSDSAEYRGANEGCYHKTCDNITTMITDSNLKFLSTTTDAIVETLNTLAIQYCATPHAGRRSVRDLVALESTDFCKVNFNTTPKHGTSGCHPVIPESVRLTMVLATIIGIYL